MSCISWLYSLRCIPFYGLQSGSYLIAKARTSGNPPPVGGFLCTWKDVQSRPTEGMTFGRDSRLILYRHQGNIQPSKTNTEANKMNKQEIIKQIVDIDVRLSQDLTTRELTVEQRARLRAKRDRLERKLYK